MSEILQLVVMTSLVSTILICWSIVLFTKSRNYKKTIRQTKDQLDNEVQKGEIAANELHATNRKLSHTSGYLDQIIQESTDLITAVDTEYRYIAFNNSFYESMKDYFEVEIEVGMKLDDILVDYPEKLAEAKQFWDRSLQGETFSAEQYFRTKADGTNIFELNYTPIKNQAGEIVGASQIARNVTEQRNIEEKIRQERDFSEAIFDVNKSLVMVVDRDGVIIQFNKACEEVSGYKANEVIGRIIWNVLIPTEDIAHIKQQNRNFDKEEIEHEYVGKWVTKDEEIKVISWQISTIEDETGTNYFIVATGIDITEKREIEIAQKRMLEILENSTDLIAIFDLHGRISYLNIAGRDMLGLQKDADLKLLKSCNFYPKWVKNVLQMEAYPTAEKDGTWLGQTAVKTLDDKEIPTSQLVMAHRNDKDKVEYYSTVIRDITYDQKLSEELAEAKESNIKTSERASEFLANMSHEIRTPMNGVVGLSELLLNTELTFEQRDYIEAIQKSGDSLLNIINDILDFSKLESGKLEFEQRDFDLHKTIESTFELFTKQINQKNLELCLHINRNVPSALIGDSGRLRQVLVNFIGNAVKFTDEGEIVVEVKVEESGRTPTIHFSVKDTGIGISADALHKLFTPFTQVDSSITRRFGGSGLGLAISKQLITKMNGDLGATSIEGEGSNFWFTAKFEAQHRDNQRIFSDERLENTRTLIVDENKTHRNNLLSLIKSWGMLPDETASADNALKLLKSAAEGGEMFEVVLINKELSGMDGTTLADRILNEPLLRKTKIILMLPRMNRKYIQRANDLGIHHFALKPIHQTKLFETFVNLFSEKSVKHFIENDTIITNPHYFSGEILNEIGTSTMNTETSDKIRILIAEDNLVNQKVILNQVSRLGYEVDLAENGKAAIDALQLKDYSLILMDCQMPVMDGYSATRIIRENEKSESERIPIIAVTAHAIEGDREKCLSVGMDDYISKPTKQQVLAKAISFWLHKSTKDIMWNSKSVEVASPPMPVPTNSETDNIKARLLELEETCGKETVIECINLFLEDTTNLLDMIRVSVENFDFEKIATDAHKLKGSSANMGATRLPRFSQKLISVAKSKQESTTTLIFKQINDEYEFIKSFYIKELEDFDKSNTLINSSV